LFERLDQRQLLMRLDAREYIHITCRRSQRRDIHILQIAAEQHARGWDARGMCDRQCGARVVTGDHHDTNPCPLALRDSGGYFFA